MSGVAGSGGKYWICLYSLVATLMLRWSVRRACGLHGTAQSVVSAVAPAIVHQGIIYHIARENAMVRG